MFRLLVILFVIKLYAQTDIFKLFKEFWILRFLNINKRVSLIAWGKDTFSLYSFLWSIYLFAIYTKDQFLWDKINAKYFLMNFQISDKVLRL